MSRKENHNPDTHEGRVMLALQRDPEFHHLYSYLAYTYADDAQRFAALGRAFKIVEAQR